MSKKIMLVVAALAGLSLAAAAQDNTTPAAPAQQTAQQPAGKMEMHHKKAMHHHAMHHKAAHHKAMHHKAMHHKRMDKKADVPAAGAAAPATTGGTQQ